MSSECVAHWINPELGAEEAEELIAQHCEPVDAFECYAVGKEVGNVRNYGPGLIMA